MDAQKLAGRAALVVGGGQVPGEDVGNGRAAAILYARHGARVAVVDRNLASAQETVALIEAEGGEAFAIQADVTSEDDVVAYVAATRARFGAIDVLHNNVGVNTGDAAAGTVDSETFDRLMAINIRGMFLSCHHTLPVMVEQGHGVIVNIASIAPLISYPAATYQVSKAGVLALSRHIAFNYAQHGIRCNSVLPGLVNTPMAVEPQVARAGGDRTAVLAARQEKVPLRGAVGTAWDTAKASLFFASDDSAYVTGAELVVDGGQTLVVG